MQERDERGARGSETAPYGDSLERGMAADSVPTTDGRSRNMRAIRRADTAPELRLRRLLHRAGLRYRTDHRLSFAGGNVRPDVVFTRVKVAVFVDSCFWHCCPDHGRRPTHNTSYWDPKLDRNIERDRADDCVLGSAGWQVVRVWEHEDLELAAARVIGRVRARAGGDRAG